MRLLLVPILLVCVSSSLQAQDKKRCADTPVDSTNPASPVYQECHVKRKASLRGTPPRPDFSPNPGGSTACYRADFAFVVDTSGAPELSTVRRVSSTDPSFAEAVEATIPRLRYAPARLDSTLVRQVVNFTSSVSLLRVVMVSSSRGGSLSPPSGSRMPRAPKC
ncbi:hypothetical protein [Gemmatimonas sp.]|uniref:hypothetical protein n=1 Tax=Gemmatimonas sp. TaxID=1962908 RepID=UPI00286D820E|nr:hypothetical protein [Gemmatimonas sp.]